MHYVLKLTTSYFRKSRIVHRSRFTFASPAPGSMYRYINYNINTTLHISIAHHHYNLNTQRSLRNHILSTDVFKSYFKNFFICSLLIGRYSAIEALRLCTIEDLQRRWVPTSKYFIDAYLCIPWRHIGGISCAVFNCTDSEKKSWIVFLSVSQNVWREEDNGKLPWAGQTQYQGICGELPNTVYLPDFITDCSSSCTFKKYLKTYLFSLSFWAHNNTPFYDCVKCPSSSLCHLRRFKTVYFTLHYITVVFAAPGQFCNSTLKVYKSCDIHYLHLRVVCVHFISSKHILWSRVWCLILQEPRVTTRCPSFIHQIWRHTKWSA